MLYCVICLITSCVWLCLLFVGNVVSLNFYCLRFVIVRLGVLLFWVFGYWLLLLGVFGFCGLMWCFLWFVGLDVGFIVWCVSFSALDRLLICFWLMLSLVRCFKWVCIIDACWACVIVLRVYLRRCVLDVVCIVCCFICLLFVCFALDCLFVWFCFVLFMVVMLASCDVVITIDLVWHCYLVTCCLDRFACLGLLVVRWLICIIVLLRGLSFMLFDFILIMLFSCIWLTVCCLFTG